MLLGTRDVSLCSIGQLNIERDRKRALSFKFQAGYRVNLIRYRRNAQVADAEGLQLQLAYRLLVKEDLLERVYLLLIPRTLPVDPGLNPIMVFIMSLFASAAMTNDRILPANRAEANNAFCSSVRPICVALALRRGN